MRNIAVEFFSKNYQSFELLQKDVRQWNLDFLKLSKGKFEGSLGFIDFGKVKLFKVTLNGTIDQRGETPKGYRCLVLPDENCCDFQWFNHTASKNKLLVFPKDKSLKGISYNEFSVYIIAIEVLYFEELVALFNESFPSELIGNELVFNLDNSFAQYLRTTCAGIINSVVNGDNDADYDQITNRLPKQLISVFSLDLLDSPLLKTKVKRDMGVKKVLDIIQKSSLVNVSLDSMVKESGISLRTLEYGFNEKFGINPVNYLKAEKLHRVRRSIISCKTKPIVGDLARKHGFSHLGQFAADYKAQFGELPKDTVKDFFSI